MSEFHKLIVAGRYFQFRSTDMWLVEKILSSFKVEKCPVPAPYITSGQSLTDLLLHLAGESGSVLEDVMCLWEAVLENRDDLDRTSWEEMGTACIRNNISELAPQVHMAWELAKQLGFDDAFDWEFCPWFVRECIDWETVTIRPNWIEIVLEEFQTPIIYDLIITKRAYVQEVPGISIEDHRAKFATNNGLDLADVELRPRQ